MLYNLLSSRPLVMLPTCWQRVANMFAKWSLALKYNNIHYTLSFKKLSSQFFVITS